MSGHSRKTKWMISGSLAIIILATVTAVELFERQQRIYKSRESLICNHEILATIRSLEASAQDAEDSGLGYRLTGSPQLLEARDRATASYRVALAELCHFELAYGKPLGEVNYLNAKLADLPHDVSVGSDLQIPLHVFSQGLAEAQPKFNKVDSAQEFLTVMRKNTQNLAELQAVQLREQILEQNIFIVTTASLYILAMVVSFLSFGYIYRQKTAAANRTRVQLAVTQALVQSNNLDEAASRVLEAIGRIYQFSFGAIWLVDEKADLIKPHTLWLANPSRYRELCEVTQKSMFSKGIGVPGQVWESGTAKWITAVKAESEKNSVFPRTNQAIQSGLHSAVGFPIVRDKKVIGVMEFFVDKLQVSQLDLMDLVSPFGHEIGQFIERVETKEMLIEETCTAKFAAEVSQVLTDTDNLDVMLQNCAELAVTHLHSIFGGVWTRSADKSSLVLRGCAGDKSALPDMATIRLDDRIETLFRRSHGKLTMLGHAMQKVAAEQSGEAGEITPLLAHPLMIGKELVGLVALQPSRPFSERALHSMAMLADSVSVVISRRQVEEKLEASDRLFTQITNNVEEMIWVTQPGLARAKWVSPALARMFGCPPSEIIDNPKLIIDAIHEDDRAAALAFFKSHSSRPTSIEYRQRRFDGSMRWIWSRIYPSLDSEGNAAEVYGMAIDITERKEAEKQVHEFYSMVSHELRTPLTSVHGSLRLMEAGMAGPLTEMSQQLVTIARTESDRLIRLINDILDIRKLDAGMLKLTLRQVEVEKLADLSFAAMKGIASEAGIVLEKCIEWSGVINVDQDRTIQMLENLLSNAIKFSPPGATVALTINRRADLVRFAVKDVGAGIAADQIAKLFGKFQQLDSSDSRPKGGSGLGLAITKALAEQHGGTAGLQSTVGEGSTFWIELPIGLDALPTLAVALAEPISEKKLSVTAQASLR
jgi:PAS domain S-box-containing protein